MKRNAVAWAALIVSLATLAGSRWSSTPVRAVPEIPAEGQKYAKGLSDAFGAVADFVRPSVVKITVSKHAGGGRFRMAPGQGGQQMNPKDLEEMLKRFGTPFEREQFGPNEQQMGTGSGFVYDEHGHILTNNHVVNGADKIVVTFYDGEKAEAKVVGTDPRADVAVIKVDTTSYRPLPKGQSGKLHVGEWVIAIGSPFELDQTVTAGIVSATDRGSVGINEFESFIQTDAAINPGNSGGPLVDLNGRVVGINSAIATSSHSNSGVGFAIPMDMATSLADKLIKDGKVNRVRVGVVLKMESLTPSLAKKLGVDSQTHGVIVGEVVEGSPGAKAGLQPNDVITEFNGQPVTSVPQFRTLVSVSDEGKPYDVKFYRGGKAQTASITPAAEKRVRFAQERRPGVSEVEDFGLAVAVVNDYVLGKLGYPEGVTGVAVAHVEPGSPAAKAGLEPKDLIVGVFQGKDGKPQPVKDLKGFLAAVEGKDEVGLLVRNCNAPDDEPIRMTLSTKAGDKDVDR